MKPTAEQMTGWTLWEPLGTRQILILRIGLMFWAKDPERQRQQPPDWPEEPGDLVNAPSAMLGRLEGAVLGIHRLGGCFSVHLELQQYKRADARHTVSLNLPRAKS